MMTIAFDLAVFWCAVVVGAFGLFVGAPVLVLVGAIFAVTGLVWMAIDIYTLVKEGR